MKNNILQSVIYNIYVDEITMQPANRNAFRYFVHFQPEYQLAVQTEGMVADMVHHLTNENKELKKHCASAIFKVSEVRRI
jgi:hypothetical protein